MKWAEGQLMYLTDWWRGKIADILRHLLMHFLECKSLFFFKISTKYLPECLDHIKSALVQVITWVRAGAKLLPESMLINPSTHICVIKPQYINSFKWVNTTKSASVKNDLVMRWIRCIFPQPWRHHQMETFSALLAICAGNSPVNGEFPAQRSVTRSFDVFFHLCLNKRLSKQSWGWWFETLSCPLWRRDVSVMLSSERMLTNWQLHLLKKLQ